MSNILHKFKRWFWNFLPRSLLLLSKQSAFWGKLQRPKKIVGFNDKNVVDKSEMVSRSGDQQKYHCNVKQSDFLKWKYKNQNYLKRQEGLTHKTV